MVVNMASQDAQSFFQPLSSWMSRMCEAVQHAGDSISSSFANLNKRDSEPRLDVNSNTNLDYKEDNFENYLDDSIEDGNSDFESSVGVPDCSHDDISLSHSNYVMDSQTPPCDQNTFKQQLDRRQDDSGSTDSRAESPISVVSNRSLQSYQAYDDDEVVEMLPTIPEEDEHIDSQIRGCLRDSGSRTAFSVNHINGKKPLPGYIDPSTASDCGYQKNLWSILSERKVPNDVFPTIQAIFSKMEAAVVCVNSYGEDEDLTTSSDSDEEVIKQFEISVSRSQSFRSAVSEKATQAGTERKQKFNHLLSNHEEYSTEASECEELDGLSQLSYQDLSYHEDDRISFDSRSPSEGRSIGGLKAAEKDGGSVHSLSRQATEGSLEMETAFSNQGFDGHDATDSSSAWSPEEHIEANALPAPQNSHEPISKCGDLDVIFDYKSSSQKLYVTVVQARGIPDKDRSGVNTWQVHAVLLPSKKQKVKTGIQRGPEPVFQEKFTFNKVEIEEFASYALRFRLYAVRKMNREKMMGEKLVYLSKINPESQVELTLVLEPRINMSSGDSHMSLSPISHSDSASSSQSLSHGGVPELLVGLAYNATTGRLSVEIIKGSHFRNLAINRPPDTYGKLCLLNSVGQEMSRCKTSIRRGQPNPVYKETFIFQVALFQLSDVTLMISIYNRRSMKRKEMIGWLSLGQNSSGEEEQSHWLEMKDSKGPQICRWHTLLES